MEPKLKSFGQCGNLYMDFGWNIESGPRVDPRCDVGGTKVKHRWNVNGTLMKIQWGCNCKQYWVVISD